MLNYCIKINLSLLMSWKKMHYPQFWSSIHTYIDNSSFAAHIKWYSVLSFRAMSWRGLIVFSRALSSSAAPTAVTSAAQSQSAASSGLQISTGCSAEQVVGPLHGLHTLFNLQLLSAIQMPVHTSPLPELPLQEIKPVTFP